MTATSQDKTEDKKDERTVPLGEHIELRQKLKQLEEENAKLKTASPPPKQEPQAPTQASAEDVGKLAGEFRRAQSIQSITEDLGLPRKQAALVQDIIDKNPNASPAEALAIAKMRAPDSFAETTAAGFQHGTHGAMRPGNAGQTTTEPKQSDHQARKEFIASLRGKDKATQESMIANWQGNMAAQMLGKRDHQLIPLPKKQ